MPEAAASWPLAGPHAAGSGVGAGVGVGLGAGAGADGDGAAEVGDAVPVLAVPAEHPAVAVTASTSTGSQPARRTARPVVAAVIDLVVGAITPACSASAVASRPLGHSAVLRTPLGGRRAVPRGQGAVRGG
jgi:hypothetical protein